MVNGIFFWVYHGVKQYVTNRISPAAGGFAPVLMVNRRHAFNPRHVQLNFSGLVIRRGKYWPLISLHNPTLW